MVKRSKKESGVAGKKVILMDFTGLNKKEVIETADKFRKENPKFRVKLQGFIEHRYYFMGLIWKEGEK